MHVQEFLTIISFYMKAYNITTHNLFSSQKHDNIYQQPQYSSANLMKDPFRWQSCDFYAGVVD